MPSKTVSPYGSWESPISADLITEGGLRLEQVRVDGSDVYWLEGRPEEAGRYVIVKRSSDGSTEDVNSAPFNARNAVHEYGGAAYAVRDGVVYFAHWDDQRLYRAASAKDNGDPAAITDAPVIERGDRYADLRISNDSNWIICIRERHFEDREADNELVAVSTSGSGEVHVLATGHDFYSSGRQNSAGDKICWLSWDHPNMPWDTNELWVADFDSASGTISNEQLVSGGKDVSIVQPEWAPDGTLVFISDVSGWWNLTKWSGGDVEPVVTPVVTEEKDNSGPAWAFGFSTYGITNDGSILLRDSQAGSGRFRTIGLDGRELGETPIPHTSIAEVNVIGGDIVYVGASPVSAAEVVRISVSDGSLITLKTSSDIELDDAYLSVPEAITFPSTDDGEAHAFYYAPKNPDFESDGTETPPLVVVSHGGPTSATGSALSLPIQYWTSRGFAVVDVNYRGSTGHGRVFRDALKSKWGVYDTDDCIAAADYLVDQGLADTNRLAIKGGSAGGYTTINALTFYDRFAVGATYYGIADLSVFVDDTHKYESRYLDSLIGPYPDAKQLYYDRSAINFTDQLSCPMIILQGLEDKIVPPSQAEIMATGLRKKGIPFSLMMFEGEQHGFRQSKNIKASLEAELYFYGRVLGFTPAGNLPGVEIENESAL